MEVHAMLQGTSHCLELSGTETVRGMKVLLGEVAGIVPSVVDLRLGDTVLEDAELVRETELTMGCEVDVVLNQVEAWKVELEGLNVTPDENGLASVMRGGGNERNIKALRLLLLLLPPPLDITPYLATYRPTSCKLVKIFLEKYPTYNAGRVWEYMNHATPDMFKLILSRTPPPSDNYLECYLRWISEQNACELIRAGYPKSGMWNERDCPALIALSGFRCSSMTAVYLQCNPECDVNVRDASRRTPLHHAARNGNYEIVVALLRARADPNAQDDYGDTPLHEAATVDFPRIISLLLEKGADPDLANPRGETPRCLAERARHTSRAVKELFSLPA